MTKINLTMLHHLTPYFTIHLKRVLDLNVKSKTTKNLEENLAGYLYDLIVDKDK